MLTVSCYKNRINLVCVISEYPLTEIIIYIKQPNVEKTCLIIGLHVFSITYVSVAYLMRCYNRFAISVTKLIFQVTIVSKLLKKLVRIFDILVVRIFTRKHVRQTRIYIM